MPGLNHKGPNGDGPLSGRGLGNCNNKTQSHNPDQATDNTTGFFGRRNGMGRGRGRQLGNGFGSGSGRGNGFQNGRHN